MCNHRSTTKVFVKDKPVRVDRCMANLIDALNLSGLETLACCCGHKKYNMSIVIRVPSTGHIWELISGVALHRTTRFYVTDKQGYYYIPEAVKVKL